MSENVIECEKCNCKIHIHDTLANMCLACVVDEIVQLRKELAEYHDAEKFVADPPHDQICCGCVTILRKQLAELQWIPVSERLPENTDEVLVTDRMASWVGWYSGHARKWIGSGKRIVTHWKPIRLPDKEANNGSKK